MSVKRYRVGVIHKDGIGFPGEMVECADGAYVRIEDYEAVAKELDKANSLLAASDALRAHHINRMKDRIQLCVKELG